MTKALRVAAVGMAMGAGLAWSAADLSPTWQREDYTLPEARPPVQAPPGNPRLGAEVRDGAFRLTDGGSVQGDLLTFNKSWCADPDIGASCRASVRVVRCQGHAGVMIGFSDGIHEDILTLYEDRIALTHAGVSHALDTTAAFREYRVDIRGTDVSVSVNGERVLHAAGGFTGPAHAARNRVSFGSGSSGSQGDSLWQWVAWTDGLPAVRAKHPVLPGAEPITVFKQEGVYAPFPALRATPDLGVLYASFAKKTQATHYETLDATRGCMESRDGGRTWAEVPALPDGLIGPRPGEVFTAADGARLRIRQNWRKYYPPERRAEFEGRYRIETPGTHKPGWFAVNSGGRVERSEDGGKTWQSNPIPELDTYSSCSSPWSYLQLRDGRVLRAFVVVSNAKDSGDVHVAITADGRTAEVHRVMGDDEEKLRFTEETLVHETTDGVIWLLTRVEGGDDHMRQAVSRDGGRTWTAARSGIKGHPPSGLVGLADGRLVLTYGYRHPPYGVRAVVSTDEGLTWDAANPFTLRNDGAGYDLGYPTSLQLPDGTILTLYYFTGDDGTTHVAATRWRVP